MVRAFPPRGTIGRNNATRGINHELLLRSLHRLILLTRAVASELSRTFADLRRYPGIRKSSGFETRPNSALELFEAVGSPKCGKHFSSVELFRRSQSQTRPILFSRLDVRAATWLDLWGECVQSFLQLSHSVRPKPAYLARRGTGENI